MCGLGVRGGDGWRVEFDNQIIEDERQVHLILLHFTNTTWLFFFYKWKDGGNPASISQLVTFFQQAQMMVTIF